MLAGLEYRSASSFATSPAGLFYLRPRNEACRTKPWVDQPRKVISATSLGWRKTTVAPAKPLAVRGVGAAELRRLPLCKCRS
jgi:hypothetical protein